MPPQRDDIVSDNGTLESHIISSDLLIIVVTCVLFRSYCAIFSTQHRVIVEGSRKNAHYILFSDVTNHKEKNPFSCCVIEQNPAVCFCASFLFASRPFVLLFFFHGLETTQQTFCMAAGYFQWNANTHAHEIHERQTGSRRYNPSQCHEI